MQTIDRGITLGITLIILALFVGFALLVADGAPIELHNSLEGKILAPLAYTPLAGLLLLYLALFTGVLGRSGSARLLFALVGLAILTSGVWLGGGTP